MFGEHANNMPISSSKSMLGHLIAAAGVVELVISVMAMRKGVLPPTINYQNARPGLRPGLRSECGPREYAFRPRPQQQLRIRRTEHLAGR